MTESAKRVVGNAEKELRRKLAMMCRILGLQGSLGLFGHVSIRVPNTDIILLSPGAGSHRTTIRADQIFALDIEGKVLHNPGGDVPSVVAIEWPIHTRIHQDRPEIGCVAHLHAYASTLLGIAGRDIVPVYSHGVMFEGGIPTYDAPALILTDEQAAELSGVLGKQFACQMRGHGSVVVGETAEECLRACTFMEENARYQIAAEALGGAKPFPDRLWKETSASHANAGTAFLVWKYWEQLVQAQGVPL